MADFCALPPPMLRTFRKAVKPFSKAVASTVVWGCRPAVGRFASLHGIHHDTGSMFPASSQECQLTSPISHLFHGQYFRRKPMLVALFPEGKEAFTDRAPLPSPVSLINTSVSGGHSHALSKDRAQK